MPAHKNLAAPFEVDVPLCKEKHSNARGNETPEDHGYPARVKVVMLVGTKLFVSNRRAQQSEVTIETLTFWWKGIRLLIKLDKLTFLEVQVHPQVGPQALDDLQSLKNILN